VIWAVHKLRHGPPGAVVGHIERTFFPARGSDQGSEADPRRAGWRDGVRRWAVRLWQLVPLLLLGAALWGAAGAEHAVDRAVVIGLAAFAAWVAFVAPGGAGGRAAAPTDRSLRVLRAAVLATVLACLLILLARDELWLAGAVVAAVALAGLCLLVAAASHHRFLPFAIAVFASVGLYGAAVTCMRIVDSPQAQPVAFLLEDGRAVCGVWVGDAGDRVQVAQVELSELGAHRRPRPRRSSLTAYRNAAVVDRALGPLQPIGRAQDQAVVLREALEREHPDSEWRDAQATCAPRAREARPEQTPERALAESVQPELIVDRRDGFWPVPVRSLFAMEDRRARLCRRVAADTCVRLRSQDDLPWAGGDGEWLEYPADGLHISDEHDDMVDALGSADPAKTSREYFLVTRATQPMAPWTVQYWFFYTFNYQPILKGHAGYHEGDFESVGLVLSAVTHRPRYVWMARHEDEGRVFVYDEDAIQKIGGRLAVYAARGSHASYESCRRQKRIQAPGGLIDDRPQCGAYRQLHLVPDNTPMTDLSRVAWACWHGRYGHHPEGGGIERVPHESADGPLGPLWQQRFGGERSEPCRGVPDPGPRDGPGEEVLPTATAARLRAASGRLDPLIDACSDWEHPVTSGSYLVTCSPEQLRRYLDSGLEDPGPVMLHVDIADPDLPRVGPATVPAVRRDPRLRRLDDWRITAAGPIRTRIYASCQTGSKGNATLEAHWADVELEAGRPLRIDDRERGVWRLRDDDGTVVATTTPHVVRGKESRKRTACGAGD
jgi:hypothetical protein